MQWITILQMNRFFSECKFKISNKKKKRNKQTKQTGIPKNMGDIDD